MSLISPVFDQENFKWTEAHGRHLLNRAGFGVPNSRAQELAKLKPADAVAVMVDYDRIPDNMATPSWLPKEVDFGQMRQMTQGLTEDERRQLRQMKDKEFRDAVSKLQVWWIDRMCHSQRPLEEKMTLFWHGHFACSAEKVKEPGANYKLNQILRTNATGNFRKLVTDVGKSPAMLRYLDNMQNTKEHPNENWARELMELFTLGIGHYSEDDIKNSARAFTGWSQRNGEFFYNVRRHDEGQKTFLGQTGNFDGYKVIEIIMQQPACADFICRKLWTFFAYENPEPEIVTALADTFRKGNYELKPVLRQMFSSRAFYSDKAMFSQVKSPAQLVVNLIVQLDAQIGERPPIAQLAMRAMGQSLFYPPNVKGWDGGKAWINTNTLLVRCNFANYLVSGVVPEFSGPGAGALKALQRQGQRRGGEMAMMDQEDGEMAMMAGPRRRQMEMMDEGTGETSRGPAGQDSGPSDVTGRTFARALGEHRANNLETRQMAQAPFHARDFFAQYHGMTAPEMVDELAMYFVGFPLDPKQRSKLINVLAQGTPPGQPVPVMKMAEEDLRATVQLLLSTGDYQVC
ncbi:MAG: DUF1800 domain-containing protein [Candidatus Sumerlaeaceae bacterium]|nr:DUF1800 domain-containing protein [Candidatus Sumerlaeaceae bacterium]